MAVIRSLQVFRGLAALAVVAHHAVLSTTAFVGSLPPQIEYPLEMGYLGVDFFFVLSGFIIMYAHMGDERTGSAVRRYSFKRLARIFPPYLPLALGMIALYAVMPGFSATGGRDFSLVSSLLLLPANEPPALSVAWTLVHEMQFYAFFLLFFISGRLLTVFLVLWGEAILVTNLVYTPSGWIRYPLSILNIEFMFGVLAAWMARGPASRIAPGWWMLAGTTLVLSMLASITTENLPFMRLAFSFGLALIVVGFARLERITSLAWPALLLLIGNASYSLYLIHNPLLSVTQRIAGRLEFGWLEGMIFGVVLSVLAGLGYYRLIERPTLDFLRDRTKRA